MEGGVTAPRPAFLGRLSLWQCQMVILGEAAHLPIIGTPRHVLQKCLRFGLSCNHCRECLQSDVWRCVLILSILSSSTCVANANPVLGELHLCLNKMKHTIVKSDALLYAPLLNDFPEDCKVMSLKCFLLELDVVLFEEGVGSEADCILHFNESLYAQGGSVHCPPCEAHALKTAKIFFERLLNVLQSMNIAHAESQALAIL